MSEARAQHYSFAHRALPSLFHKDPEEMVAVLKSDRRYEALTGLWAAIAAELPEEERLDRQPFGVQSEQLDGGGTIVVVTMPRPVAPPEAFFAALVVRAERKPFLFFSRRVVASSYFTLELGVDVATAEPRTVLCAWTKDGKHVNYGTGPAAEVPAFFAAVKAVLSGSPQPDAISG